MVRLRGNRSHGDAEPDVLDEEEWDVVIVGSGAAGLCSALVAAKRGLKVLVLEKTDRIGGSSAWSLGVCWVPANRFAEKLGEHDDVESAREYLKFVLGNVYDDALVTAFLDTIPDAMAYLEAHSALRFAGSYFPDYRSDAPGSRSFRSVSVQPFDGRRLGKRLKDVRLPPRFMRAFGSMQVNIFDIARLRRVLVDPAAFGLAARYGWRLLREGIAAGRGTTMTNGNALVGGLLDAGLRAGVRVATGRPVVDLLNEHGRIAGVRVGMRTRTRDVRSRLGVILATGGFGADRRLIEQAGLAGAEHPTLQPEGNTGDGLAMAERYAAARGGADAGEPLSLVPMSEPPGYGTPYPHFSGERCLPGSIIVDRRGCRFANEAQDYPSLGAAIRTHSPEGCFLIMDAHAVRRWGIGPAMPSFIPPKRLERSGYLTRASSLEELARKLGLPTTALARTVERFNADAARGKDREFGRGNSGFERMTGDPEASGNRNLGPVDRPPFYGVRLLSGSAGTSWGLATSPDAEVLKADGDTIPGLYAVGLDQNNVFGGISPGGGNYLGPALAFGFRAANHVAELREGAP